MHTLQVISVFWVFWKISIEKVPYIEIVLGPDIFDILQSRSGLSSYPKPSVSCEMMETGHKVGNESFCSFFQGKTLHEFFIKTCTYFQDRLKKINIIWAQYYSRDVISVFFLRFLNHVPNSCKKLVRLS